MWKWKPLKKKIKNRKKNKQTTKFAEQHYTEAKDPNCSSRDTNIILLQVAPSRSVRRWVSQSTRYLQLLQRMSLVNIPCSKDCHLFQHINNKGNVNIIFINWFNFSLSPLKIPCNKHGKLTTTTNIQRITNLSCFDCSLNNCTISWRKCRRDTSNGWGSRMFTWGTSVVFLKCRGRAGRVSR